MRLEEQLLLLLSRKQKPGHRKTDESQWDIDNALSQLTAVFPDFINLIQGKQILDFGCGAGYQTFGLAQRGAKFVLGLEIDQKAVKMARDLTGLYKLSDKVKFSDVLDSSFYGRFDMVISQNSFEHFNNPEHILNTMRLALKENGALFITFGSPWFSPHGSHAQFFIPLPYANLFFSEKAIMNIRAYFRNDGAHRYEDVEGGLNKMTVVKFERILSSCGMRLLYKRYDCVKKLNFLKILPYMRELFINRISCILSN